MSQNNYGEPLEQHRPANDAGCPASLSSLGHNVTIT